MKNRSKLLLLVITMLVVGGVLIRTNGTLNYEAIMYDIADLPYKNITFIIICGVLFLIVMKLLKR